MAKFQPWLKMWVEWVDDPKMLSLSLAEQGAWWRLCTLAKKCAADGFLVKGRGAPLSLEEIADAIRITAKADRKVFDSMTEKMIDLGSLHWNSKALVVTHFAERQAKTASETHEAVAERVRRFRERKAVTEKALQELGEEIRVELIKLPQSVDRLADHEVIKNKLAQIGEAKGLIPKSEFITEEGRLDLIWQDPKGNILAAFEIDYLSPKDKSLKKLEALECPFPFVILRGYRHPSHLLKNIMLVSLHKERESSKEKEPLPTKDIDTEAEAEVTSLHSVTFEPALAEISKLHEQYFGIITPNLSEKFKDFVENYRGPVEWIKLAFAEAVKYKSRRWQYVETILYSWQEKGGPHADREERGAGERAGAPADRRDPLAVTKQRGWKVKRSGPKPSNGEKYR